MLHDTRTVDGLVVIDPRQTLIGRDAERARLAALLARPRASLARATDRRRIGKTDVLTRAWPAELAFLFTATRTTPTPSRRTRRLIPTDVPITGSPDPWPREATQTATMPGLASGTRATRSGRSTPSPNHHDLDAHVEPRPRPVGGDGRHP